MADKTKHKIPTWCRFRRAIVGVSPSKVMTTCSMGVSSCCKCRDCEGNLSQIFYEGFMEGLERGWQETLFEKVTPNQIRKALGFPEVESEVETE